MLLLSNLSNFAFIPTLLLASESSMLVTSIQFGLFTFILALLIGSELSILVTPIQFGLFCIYSCLIFSWSAIYACYLYLIWLILHLFCLISWSVIYAYYPYPIWLILHLFIPYF